MVIVKYVGPGRYGTAVIKQIWAPGEQKDVPPEVAKELLKDPYFIKVKQEPKTKGPVGKPVRGSKKKSLNKR